MSLSTAQKAAIAAGKPVRQAFYIKRPEDSAHSAYETTLFDEGCYGDRTLKRVTNPGRRNHQVANVSPVKPGKLKATAWQIECDNRDGFWCERPGSAYTHSTTGYVAKAQECFIEHRVSVLVAGAWSELTDIRFLGEILDVEYEDGTDHEGLPLALVATLVLKDAGAAAALGHIFDENDAVDGKVTDVASGDAYFTVT